jgi:hypothetical protein
MGVCQLAWDSRDNQGQAVAPGIYFYKVIGCGKVSQGKLLKDLLLENNLEMDS